MHLCKPCLAKHLANRQVACAMQWREHNVHLAAKAFLKQLEIWTGRHHRIGKLVVCRLIQPTDQTRSLRFLLRRPPDLAESINLLDGSDDLLSIMWYQLAAIV